MHIRHIFTQCKTSLAPLQAHTRGMRKCLRRRQWKEVREVTLSSCPRRGTKGTTYSVISNMKTVGHFVGSCWINGKICIREVLILFTLHPTIWLDPRPKALNAAQRCFDVGSTAVPWSARTIGICQQKRRFQHQAWGITGIASTAPYYSLGSFFDMS